MARTSFTSGMKYFLMDAASIMASGENPFTGHSVLVSESSSNSCTLEPRRVAMLETLAASAAPTRFFHSSAHPAFDAVLLSTLVIDHALTPSGVM